MKRDIVALVWLAVLFLAAGAIGAVICALAVGCTPSTTPPSPPGGITAETVTRALEDAGCLAPSPDDVSSIAAEHARVDAPAWLGCLFDGGSIAGCGVPCGP